MGGGDRYRFVRCFQRHSRAPSALFQYLLMSVHTRPPYPVIHLQFLHSTLTQHTSRCNANTATWGQVHAHFAGDMLGRSAVAVNPGVVIGPVMTKAHTKASAIFLRDITFNNKVRKGAAQHMMGGS